MKHVFRFNGIEWSADVKDAEKFNEEVLIMLEGLTKVLRRFLFKISSVSQQSHRL